MSRHVCKRVYGKVLVKRFVSEFGRKITFIENRTGVRVRPDAYVSMHIQISKVRKNLEIIHRQIATQLQKLVAILLPILSQCFYY